MRPFLSVLMPTYNGERFVASALASVREQSAEDIEIVVVDDSSTDGTREIVREFRESMRIKLLTPGRIGNWVAITNVALQEAEGEWACFLHQDDFWLPGRISKIREAIRRAKGKLVLHNAVFVGPNGNPLGSWTCPFPAGEISPGEFVERLLVQNFIAIPSPVFLRNAALDTGGLDESLWFSADWDFWLRLGALGPVEFILEKLAAFRLHSASQTMARKIPPGDWEHQLTTVLNRHFSAVPLRDRRMVRRVATASIFVNASLASASRGQRTQHFQAMIKLLSLGPHGFLRYLRDSRIAERVRSRLKIRKQFL